MFKYWKLVKIIFALTLLLSITEIALRLCFGLGSPPLMMQDPQIEYLYVPNQKVRRFNNNIEYNSFSMRNSRDPKDDEKVILVIGDSIINGGATLDQTEIATSKLEVLLNEKEQGQYFVANVSAGSWGPENILEYLIRFGFFGADQVIYLVSSHDLYDIPTFAPLNRHTQPTKNYNLALDELVQKYLMRYTKLLVGKVFPSPLNQNTGFENQTAGPKMAQLMQLISANAKNVCVVLHPDFKELEEHGSEKYSRLNDFIHLHSSGIKIIDSLNYHELSDYRDDIHLNAAGHTILADVLSKCSD